MRGTEDSESSFGIGAFSSRNPHISARQNSNCSLSFPASIEDWMDEGRVVEREGEGECNERSDGTEEAEVSLSSEPLFSQPARERALRGRRAAAVAERTPFPSSLSWTSEAQSSSGIFKTGC